MSNFNKLYEGYFGEASGEPEPIVNTIINDIQSSNDADAKDELAEELDGADARFWNSWEMKFTNFKETIENDMKTGDPLKDKAWDEELRTVADMLDSDLENTLMSPPDSALQTIMGLWLDATKARRIKSVRNPADGFTKYALYQLQSGSRLVVADSGHTATYIFDEDTITR